MAFSICKLCNTKHHTQSGLFTRHLKEEHNMSLKEYIVLSEYNGIAPKCQCGYCNESPNFRRGKFSTHAIGHKNFDYLKEQHIKLNGTPKCPTCNNDILSWDRGKPRKYCNRKCQPNNWNQDKVKKTVRERYGVDNVYQIPEIIDKIRHIDKNVKKSLETKRKRYKNEAFDPDVMKASMQERYGVDCASQIPKNKEAASKRMIEFNRDWFKNVKIKKYKETDLYYQSSYELEFLELCESLGVLNKLNNGSSYKCDNKYLKNRILTDFSMGDIEIEIKSSYIMKQQGGLKVLNAKRKTVEDSGKNYIVILDRDYSEFLEIING